ncbi:MAG: hypothetical protein OK436_02410 [Thaumarchaeota archaeon]|nr:hypothetical protein [Nitrososphaerota archaeon]
MAAADVVLGVLATVLPFYLGLATFQLQAVRRHPQGMLFLATGMSFYFLFDGFVDSTELGVALGYYGGLLPLVLIAAFGGTFLLLAFTRRGPSYAWPLWIIALGISIHSFAEANDLANAAPLYFSNLNAVLPDAASFVIHKFLEGLVLAAAATIFGASRLRQVALAGTPMVLVGLAGSLSSLLPLGLSPFIAAGVGGWMAVTLALASRLDRDARPALFLLLIVGFVIVYSATLLHYTGLAAG